MSGKFGSALLVANAVTLLCTVPAGTTVLNIRGANSANTSTSFSVWIGDGASPQPKDLITPAVVILPNSPYEDTAKVPTPGEKVWCMANAAGFSVRVDGMGA